MYAESLADIKFLFLDFTIRNGNLSQTYATFLTYAIELMHIKLLIKFPVGILMPSLRVEKYSYMYSKIILYFSSHVPFKNSHMHTNANHATANKMKTI